MDEKQLQALLEQKFAEGINRREEDLELQRMLAQKQAEGPVQADLSGFFDMAALAGASPRVGARYQAPKQQNINDMLAPMQKAEGALADDQINYLKTKLAGQAAKKNDYTQSRFDEAKNIDAYKYVKGAFDKPLKDINEFNLASRGVASALETGDVFSVQNALSNFARMGGEKGVLTDQDIARVMPGNLETNIVKVRAWLSGDPTIPMPKEMVDSIKGRIGELEIVARKKLEDQVRQQEEMFEYSPDKMRQFSGSLAQVAKKDLQIPKKEKKTEEVNSVMSSGEAAKPKPKPKVSPIDIDNMTLEELQAAGLL
jgi:spore coat protein CotF